MAGTLSLNRLELRLVVGCADGCIVGLGYKVLLILVSETVS